MEDNAAEITGFVNDKICALNEYRTNYKAGKTKAVMAHDMLNKLLDDDCGGALLGDLLLNPTKQELTDAEYQKDPNSHADLVTILMQGNSMVDQSVMKALSYAADTASDTWTDRLLKSGDYKAMEKQIKDAHPDYNTDEAENSLIATYDEFARILAASAEDMRTLLRAYTSSGLNMESTEEEINAYLGTLSEDGKQTWAEAGLLYEALDTLNYDGGTLAEFFMNPEYDFVNDVKARERLYPFVAAMSEGQTHLLGYLSLKEMLELGLMTETEWQETLEAKRAELEAEYSFSVYYGVDRSLFDPDGIAVTNDAFRIQATAQAPETEEPKFLTGAIVAVAIGEITIISGAALLFKQASKFNEEAAFWQKSVDSSLGVTTNIHSEETVNAYANSLIKKHKELVDLMPKDMYDQYLTDVVNLPTVTVGEELKFDWLSKHYNELMADENTPLKFKEALEKFHGECKAYGERLGDYCYWKGEMTSAQRTAKIAQVFGVVLSIAAFLLAVGTAVVSVKAYYDYYHVDMKPIPRVMVDQTFNNDGSYALSYYYAVKCNRNEMNMGNEALGDYGDLNGDVMKEWLALYTTKDAKAGSPIQAGFTVKKGTTQMPVRTVPLSFFGFDSAVNMTDTKYTYNNDKKGIYLYYKQTASKYTGTVETGNVLVTTGVLSAIGGAGICGLIVALVSKRKKKQPEGTPTAA